MNLRRSLLLFSVFLILPILFIRPASAGAETMVVGGEMSYRYALVSDDGELLSAFPEYSNESNSQKVVSRSPGRIVVENRAFLEPFSSNVPFPVGERYRADPEMEPYLEMATRQSGVRITIRNGVRSESPFEQVSPLESGGVSFISRRAGALAGDADSQQEVVEQIILSLREDVSYLLNASHDPLQVLRSRRADCDGYSNAAAVLLRSLGIPVKVVDSYIPPGHMWGYGPEGSGGYHAHIEVYYDDAGWVSYDVQATLHFVDPFHIVGFPRSGVRIEPIGTGDSRTILGTAARPAGENHFFTRITPGREYPPLFVGSVTDHSGEMVKDSPRSGQWIYRRGRDGSGEGILVLPTGEFAVSPSMFGGADSGDIFYPGNNGSYFEYRIDFGGMAPGSVERRSFDLRSDGGFSLRLPSRNSSLYRWHSGDGGRWSLEEVSPDSRGILHAYSNLPGWIVSLSRNPGDPRYRFSPPAVSGSVEVASLPLYLEPGERYLFFGEGFDGMSVSLADQRGRIFEGGKVSDLPYLMVPGTDFNRVLLYGADTIAFGSTGPGISDGGSIVHTLEMRHFDRNIELELEDSRRALLLLEKEGNSWRRILRIAGPRPSLQFRYRSGEEAGLENMYLLSEGGSNPVSLQESGENISLPR